LFFHAAFNLGLILRQTVGLGKPRRLQDAVGGSVQCDQRTQVVSGTNDGMVMIR